MGKRMVAVLRVLPLCALVLRSQTVKPRKAFTDCPLFIVGLMTFATGLSAIAPESALALSFSEPFPCGETWYAGSHPGHVPSLYSLDWNTQVLPGKDGNNDEGQVVVASQSGTVAEVSNGTAYGSLVLLDHFGGEATLYAHLNEIWVTVGQEVRTGDELGTVGSTGSGGGTWAHLHYEQRESLHGAVKPATFHGMAVSYTSDSPIWFGLGQKFVSGNKCHVPSTADEAGANTPNHSAWQNTHLQLQANQKFSIGYESGSWTVDSRYFPYMELEGYPPEIDRQIYQGCKYVASWPYAVLLGKIGEMGELLPLDHEGVYTAPQAGTLFLRIHDNDGCLMDNDGFLTIQVTPR